MNTRDRAILEALRDGKDHWGRDVRAASGGRWFTMASFYELMSRMEEAGLVDGRYDDREVLGQPFRERCYRITRAGLDALESPLARR